jgi:nucleoid-associated protein YgaU
LDLLANQFYGDVTAWPIIATANNIGLGTLNIESGKQLRIPDPNKFRDYIIQINNFNQNQ